MKFYLEQFYPALSHISLTLYHAHYTKLAEMFIKIGVENTLVNRKGRLQKYQIKLR